MIRCLTTALLAGLSLLHSAGNVRAGVTISDVQVGIGGTLRAGVWTRCRTTLQADAPVECRVEVVAADPSGSPVTRRSETVSLAGAGPAQVDVHFQCGRLESSILVRVVQTDGVVAATRRLYSMPRAGAGPDLRITQFSEPQWLVVGSMGTPATESGDDGFRAELAESDIRPTWLASEDALPDDAQTLSACDIIILAGRFEVTGPQSVALQQWVAGGGHLIVAIGSRTEALQSSPLAKWILNDRTIRSSTLSDLAGLETVAASKFRIPVATRIQGTIIEQEDGVELAGSVDGLLLARFARGFGRVSLLSLDLDRPPLSRWRGLSAFVVALADQTRVERSENARSGRSMRISRSGVTELATQMYASMEQLPDVGRRSNLRVLGWILLYLVVIGPLDYLVVHRLLKKPRLTWFTFPTAAVIAGIFASTIAQATNGDQMRVKLVEVIDVDGEGGHVRQSAWATIYSPANQRYSVVMPSGLERLTGEVDSRKDGAGSSAGLKVNSSRVGWAGIPEATYGGMYRAGGLESGRPAYRMNDRADGAENLPIAKWSDRMLWLEAQGTAQTPLFESRLNRTGTGQLAPGSEFVHHLPVPIEEWLVVYGNRAYFHTFGGHEELSAGALLPGAVWSPGSGDMTTRELRSYLTNSTFIEVYSSGGGEHANTQSLWDSRSTDMQSILRIITFHELVNGSRYTRLSNTALQRLELSSLNPLDRAILFGRIKLPLAGVTIDGAAVEPHEQEQFIRVCLPVTDTPTERLLPKFDKK